MKSICIGNIGLRRYGDNYGYLRLCLEKTLTNSSNFFYLREEGFAKPIIFMLMLLRTVFANESRDLRKDATQQNLVTLFSIIETTLDEKSLMICC